MYKLKENSEYDSIIDFANNGNASVTIEDRTVFIFKKNTLNSLNGDKVRVKIIINKKKVEAEVIQVLERNKTQFVGKVHINKGNTFIIPASQKIPVDFYIKGSHDATNDQKVLVEFIKWEPGEKSPKAKIIKVLGNSGDNNTEIKHGQFRCWNGKYHDWGRDNCSIKGEYEHGKKNGLWRGYYEESKKINDKNRFRASHFERTEDVSTRKRCCRGLR
jgi:hypothetical protein